MSASRRKPGSGEEGNAVGDASERSQYGRPAHEKDGDPLREIVDYVAQFCDYAEYFARAQRDSLRLAVRDARWRFVREVTLLAVSVGFVVTAIVYVFDGTARGLDVFLGGRPWLASLVTGIAALLVFGSVVWTGVRCARREAYRKRVEEYEALKDRQRARFGHDVEELDRAARRETLPATAGARRAGRRAASHNGDPARRAGDH